MSGLNDFAPFRSLNTTFVVRNTGFSNKIINIFQYPIPVGMERDLLKIPGVGEADIRASLLKGELNHKIRAREIVIVHSDIDLLQFNDEQKVFLKTAGIFQGLSVDSTNILRREDQLLIGDVDGINITFAIPDTYFVYDSLHPIIVYRNGVKQLLGSDFYIAESGGPGTGYNTINFVMPPDTNDILTVDYYIGQ